MKNCTALGLFDQRLRDLVDQRDDARPFLCDGTPLKCKIFLVGINLGTDTPFWPRWSPETGCDKQGWVDDYLEKHGRYRPTRERIDRLCNALSPLRVLETNIFPYRSRREADLGTGLRDTRVFDFLLESIRPRIVFVHGRSAVARLTTLMQVNLPLRQFVAASYRGTTFDLLAGDHLSYQWSYVAVERLAQALRDRYFRNKNEVS